jgi:hypothetical protein
LQEDSARRVIKNQQVNTTNNNNISIRHQMVENVEEFSYLGYHVTKDQTLGKEIETRTTKASRAFNMLRHIIWSRKTISLQAKLRIFLACVLPVLMYGSEVWSLTKAQERRLASFYHKCLRTIIGVNIGDRMTNDQLLKLTGQPSLNDILRRNRLRWFGHVNRAMTNDNEPSIVKKVMFSYYPQAKRPRNHGIRKRWEDKITEDMENLEIRNWRRQTLNRKQWRQMINKYTQYKPVVPDVINVIQNLKQQTQSRKQAMDTKTIGVSHKVTEVIARNADGTYTCPICNKTFKPQGVTQHVKSCSKQWCQQNNIR